MRAVRFLLERLSLVRPEADEERYRDADAAVADAHQAVVKSRLERRVIADYEAAEQLRLHRGGR